MIAAALIAVLGWATLASFRAAAAQLTPMLICNFAKSMNREPYPLGVCRLNWMLELGETVTMYVNDDGPLSFAGFFEAPDSIDGSRIRIDLTARAASGDDQVVYNVVLRFIDGDGAFVGEPIEPELTVEFGSQAEIVIGFDIVGAADEMLEISLRPNAR